MVPGFYPGWILGMISSPKSSQALKVHREVVKVLQNHEDVALRDLMGTVGWVGVGFDGLRGLFLP